MGAALMTREPEAADDLLNVEQVAKLLGVSRPTIYRLMRDGRLTPATPDNPALLAQRRKFRRVDVERLARGEPPEQPPAEG